MLAELYLLPESFRDNGTLSREEIESKVKLLAEDFVKIQNYKKTNKIFVNPEIYGIPFIGEYPLEALLFNPKLAKTVLNRDEFNAIQTIVLKSSITEHSSNHIIETLIPSHTQDICYGLIAFNTVDGIESEFQVIYNFGGWTKFRRHFLGLYPRNSEFFIQECPKYFPNLYFHNRISTVIGTILSSCSKKIIFHLSALNDNFNFYFIQENLNRSQKLTQFSIGCHLDETASLEGNAARKRQFTFTFTTETGEQEDVCCEPHLKICYSDNSNAYSTNRRIYFHEGKPNIQSGKILIGHIGSHL